MIVDVRAGFVDEVDRCFGGPLPSAPARSDDDVPDGVLTGVVTFGARSMLGQRGGQAEDHRACHEHSSNRIADVVLKPF